MTTALDHLRSKIVHRTAECGTEYIGGGTPSKVRDLQNIIVCNQEVLRLQVPVHDLMRMKVLQTPHQLHEEVLRHLFVELPPLLGPQKLIQLSLGTVLQEQKDVLFILKVLEKT